jgi:hypothetical protein
MRYRNKNGDTVIILDIVVKKTRDNVKQHKRQGQRGKYWFDDHCKRGKKISGLSEKE